MTTATPTPTDLLDMAGEHGIRLDASPEGNLRVKMPGDPPPGFVDGLRECKAAVLEALRARRYGECPPPDLPLAEAPPGLANPAETDPLTAFVLEGQPDHIVGWLCARVDAYRAARPHWKNADAEMAASLDLAGWQRGGIAPGDRFPVLVVRLVRQHRPARVAAITSPAS